MRFKDRRPPEGSCIILTLKIVIRDRFLYFLSLSLSVCVYPSLLRSVAVLLAVLTWGLAALPITVTLPLNLVSTLVRIVTRCFPKRQPLHFVDVCLQHSLLSTLQVIIPFTGLALIDRSAAIAELAHAATEAVCFELCVKPKAQHQSDSLTRSTATIYDGESETFSTVWS